MKEYFLPLLLKCLACKLVADVRFRMHETPTTPSTLLSHNVDFPLKEFTMAVENSVLQYMAHQDSKTPYGNI